jgi:3-dehydroquinate synthase
VRLSEKIAGLSGQERQRIENLIKATGLPTSIPEHMNPELILAKLKADKKKSGKTINFVLIRKIGEPFVTGEVGENLLRATIEGLKR